MATKRKATGTLNSKEPNPYELAYKELWDKLPAWKKLAVTEDQAAGKDSGVLVEFTKAVSHRAEQIYTLNENLEKAKLVVEKN